MTRVAVLRLPIPEELWQQILWLSARAGVAPDEWLCRAAIEQGGLDRARRERLERELAATVAHARKDGTGDLAPAWLPGGVGMLPVEAVAPLPARVSLKNYRRRGPHESGGFRASVYLDGRRIGTVSNDGFSSRNDYEFLDPTDGKEFFAHARSWGHSKGVETHPDADLLDELCLELDDLSEARKMVRGGAIAVIATESSPCWLPDNTSIAPNYYEDHGLVSVEPGETPEEVAARESCTRWRIVATTDPSQPRTSWRARPRGRRDRRGAYSTARDPQTARCCP